MLKSSVHPFIDAAVLLLLLPIAACTPPSPEEQQPPPATPAAIEQIGAVTDELLQAGHKEQPATWPTYGGDWAQTRYSALDEIRRDNVARLRPAWLAQTGIVGSFETTPVVLGQEMYVTTPAEQGVQHVLRLDATTGEVVWRVKLDAQAAGRTAASEDLHLPTDFGPNRGVAVYGNRVYVGTLNGTLLALERGTGARAFEVKTLSARLSGAPLAARGRIVLGLSWLERGAVQAFDAESGALAWTWYTNPLSRGRRMVGRVGRDASRDRYQPRSQHRAGEGPATQVRRRLEDGRRGGADDAELRWRARTRVRVHRRSRPARVPPAVHALPR